MSKRILFFSSKINDTQPSEEHFFYLFEQIIRHMSIELALVRTPKPIIGYRIRLFLMNCHSEVVKAPESIFLEEISHAWK